MNDEFHLDGVGITELHFIKIYNRWGQKVYESNNFNGKWDGRINGKKSEPEVFDYFLEAVCSTGQLIRKQGNITLIRWQPDCIVYLFVLNKITGEVKYISSLTLTTNANNNCYNRHCFVAAEYSLEVSVLLILPFFRV